MDKEQNIRAAYVKPEIKTVHVLMDKYVIRGILPWGPQAGSPRAGTYGRVK